MYYSYRLYWKFNICPKHWILHFHRKPSLFHGPAGSVLQSQSPNRREKTSFVPIPWSTTIISAYFLTFQKFRNFNLDGNIRKFMSLYTYYAIYFPTDHKIDFYLCDIYIFVFIVNTIFILRNSSCFLFLFFLYSTTFNNAFYIMRKKKKFCYHLKFSFLELTTDSETGKLLYIFKCNICGDIFSKPAGSFSYNFSK